MVSYFQSLDSFDFGMKVDFVGEDKPEYLEKNPLSQIEINKIGPHQGSNHRVVVGGRLVTFITT